MNAQPPTWRVAEAVPLQSLPGGGSTAPAEGPGAPETNARDGARSQEGKGGDEIVESVGIDNKSIDFAMSTHANLQDMVKVADAKAAVLTTLQSLMLAVLGQGIAPAVAVAIKTPSPAGWFLVISAAVLVFSTALSIGLAVLVLLPRFPKDDVPAPTRAPRLMWVSDLARFWRTALDRPDAYVDCLRSISKEQVLTDFAFENLKIAWILDKKFGWLKHAVRALFLALVALVLTLVAWSSNGSIGSGP